MCSVPEEVRRGCHIPCYLGYRRMKATMPWKPWFSSPSLLWVRLKNWNKRKKNLFLETSQQGGAPHSAEVFSSSTHPDDYLLNISKCHEAG
ncbi:hypothetical protein LEMLEM_LOCUS7307, partial [Lemmus lemmus]